LWLTWRRIGVIGREFNQRFEIASIVHGIGVEDDESDIPAEDVLIV
jgi:hypothetical protein